MAANQSINSVINLAIPAQVPDDFQTPEVRAAVALAIGGIQNLHRYLEQYLGVSQKDITIWSSIVPSDTLLRHQLGRYYAVASENIGYGDLINIHNTAGIANVRKANAAAGLVKPARGFCTTTGGVLSGARGEFILSQGILPLAGINSGDAVYLSAAALGGYTTVAPVGAGQLEQFVGVAVATNLLYIDISMGSYIQH